MTYAQKILQYYNTLAIPEKLPQEVEVLYPFNRQDVNSILQEFYNKYFSDNRNRTFLIGINPGRFGGGITGIPFTDPVRLIEELEINNKFEPKQELSSRFIYQMIDAIGGPKIFYQNFYFTSVSPLGFVKNGKNLNYYDIPALKSSLEEYIVAEMKKQLAFGANKIAFSLGMGQNIAYLRKLNARHRLFDEIIPLPHPRWIMQYRLKRLDEFVQHYASQLSQVIA
ncbi:MAG: uracil-DNA glycosylase family protein [Fulvivirga sp.]